jgi:transcription-repair coupling factor (superfamily II helicase)
MDPSGQILAQGLEPILALLREGRRSLRVATLAGSAPAALAAAIAVRHRRPVLLLAPDPGEADKLREECDFFLRAEGAAAAALVLPGREVFRSLPYAAGWRTAALAAMVGAAADRPTVVSASIEAAMLRTAPPDLFADHLLELRPGSSLDRDRFLETLIRSGYTAVSQAMEPGDFSVRGGIVDVFPPGAEHPVRIELLGDEVATLRRFDPDTQKSVGPERRALIPPLKEAILRPEEAANARAYLLDLIARFKDGRLPTPDDPRVFGAGAETIERLESRDSFPGIQTLLPAFFRERVCALDYLDPRWVTIYLEPFLCQQALLRRFAELTEEWTRLLAAGDFVLPPGESFAPRDPATQKLGETAVVAVGMEPVPSAPPGPDESERPGFAGAGAPGPPPAAGEALAGIVSDLGGLKVRPEEAEPLAPLLTALQDFIGLDFRVIFVSPMPAKAERLRELLFAHGLDLPVRPEAAAADRVSIVPGTLQRGFVDLAGKLAVIPEAEIFGEKIRPAQKARRGMESFLSDLSDLRLDDFVVHVDHGVGAYRGLTSLAVQWVGEWDFVHERERPKVRVDAARVEYAEGATLYVPVHRINQISKYRGPSESPPALDTLGGPAWERVKKKVKKDVREFAAYLLRIYAARRVHGGIVFPPPDATFREFEEAFEYEETPDQLRAIEDVLNDMESEEPMDRVVCGDVGYGKTEVALRAAFLAAMSGRQVAVLVPTTILADQHYHTFKRRLAKYPLQVRALSRFLLPREQKAAIAAIAAGQVDIAIGTHRLLSKDVKFQDLGLLVIDEEHRFGVRHKERLRELKTTVATLTLTATPIPRTLHMAFSGLRDISIINTPPPDRLAVHTELVRADDRLLKEAMERELRRGGQVFYVHNRVQTIAGVAEKVRRLVPSAKIAVAHGQMPEKELERVMREFVGRRYDVLVCTAIIESGLDIPTVNTMIVDRADTFGLAQLYQLRGRIGRSKDRGYCYLTIPAKGLLTREAAERLRALKEFTELGSGFRIAAHDLEIRGAGNILGSEQSGHILRLGIDLYMRLLEDEVKNLKGEEVEPEFEPEIKLPIGAYLPEDYMPDQNQRLSWYKRISRARVKEELDTLQDELIDRYGPLPEPVRNLMAVALVKLFLLHYRVRELAYTGAEISLTLAEDTRADVDHLIALAARDSRRYRLAPDNRFFFRFTAKDPAELMPGIHAALKELAGKGKNAADWL